jgi:hypothetical protein
MQFRKEYFFIKKTVWNGEILFGQNKKILYVNASGKYTSTGL